ncbi:hypothetical protein FB451DRAFT_683278 [Mycena latifolia]|nr:hypothetical protein FB451DRAFT_683278 [Mycena latifolia]
MFKNAATKLAHNTTIPALSGNKDLRPLQDLITAEKVVLVSLQKLSVDFAKAAEALRIWGTGEGDDLGDILGASTTILAHFSGALSGRLFPSLRLRVLLGLDGRLGAVTSTPRSRPMPMPSITHHHQAHDTDRRAIPAALPEGAYTVWTKASTRPR